MPLIAPRLIPPPTIADEVILQAHIAIDKEILYAWAQFA
jgi:hypothetical protein